mmetsp:Transcript_16950/g.35918  ORF Transcript_16950/g.35918 Transcript_16950/m.35918 type:complete len:207 (-) Transcript_16950:819-1439(-)
MSNMHRIVYVSIREACYSPHHSWTSLFSRQSTSNLLRVRKEHSDALGLEKEVLLYPSANQVVYYFVLARNVKIHAGNCSVAHEHLNKRVFAVNAHLVVEDVQMSQTCVALQTVGQCLAALIANFVVTYVQALQSRVGLQAFRKRLAALVANFIDKQKHGGQARIRHEGLCNRLAAFDPEASVGSKAMRASGASSAHTTGRSIRASC